MRLLNFRYEVSHNVAAGCEDFLGVFQDVGNIQRLVQDAVDHKKTLIFREVNARDSIFAKDESYAILHKRPGKPGYCVRVERASPHSYSTPWEGELLALLNDLIHETKES